MRPTRWFAASEWLNQARRHSCEKGKILERRQKGSACAISDSSVASELRQVEAKKRETMR